MEQRKRIYAMLRDISEWMGELDPEVVKNYMKIEFMVNDMNAIARRLFSLSDCDMTTAREFNDFLEVMGILLDFYCYFDFLILNQYLLNLNR